MIRPFFIALQFLTRIPVRLAGEPSPRELGLSLLYYPLVGLLLGALLAGGAWLLLRSGIPPLLGAALILSLWVALTGALHLDGLADSIDAWAGGRGDRERTLAIMKDPASGPQGVTGLVLVLLLKFAALHSLLGAMNLLASPLAPLAPPEPLAPLVPLAPLPHMVSLLPLLLAPLLARTGLPLLFLTTSYVRPGGLGASLAAGMPRPAARAVLVAAALATVAVAGLLGQFLAGCLGLSLALATFTWLRHLMRQRIGGTTGDTAGALVEIIETLVLLGLAIALPLLSWPH